MSNAAQKTTAPVKAEIRAGGNVAAFRPQTFDEAWRLANALATGSQKMIPDHYRGDPGATFAAMAKGAELGMSPMAALSTIAVINGRPSLWGDALPALVLKGGHQLHEEVTGEGDKMVATATVKRGDTGQEITRTFSVDDAKAAQLWNKKGPWQQYPKRMLQMRARGFAVRDGCADMMVGLGVAEELSDIKTPMRDVTPPAEQSNSILSALPEEPSEEAAPEPEIKEPESDPEPSNEPAQGELIDQEPEPEKPDYSDFMAKLERRMMACIDHEDIDEAVEQYADQIAAIRETDEITAAAIDTLIEARKKAVAA